MNALHIVISYKQQRASSTILATLLVLAAYAIALRWQVHREPQQCGSTTCDGGRASLELRQGDHVLFAKYSGTEMIVDDEIYLVLKENDVLAVLDS